MQGFVSNVNLLKRKITLAKNNLKNFIAPLTIIFSVVIIDQLTKWWAVANLSGKPSVEILGKFFMLTLVYNEGGALGTNFGPSKYYLISSSLILLFVLYYIYLNIKIKPIALPLSLISAGAIGNIIDRIYYGKVVDFLDVDFFDIDLFGYQLQRWWTFNIADSAISCSIVFLLIYSLFFHKEPATKVENENSVD